MSSNGIITNKFFGLHVGNGGQYWPTRAICGSWRSWDQMSAWRSMQATSGGAIDWTSTDAAINAAYAKGVDIVVTLGLTPTAMALSTVIGATIIGSANPTNSYCPYTVGNNAPPQNLSDWIAYVTAFGNRYLGKVKYYEIWNEIQDPQFFSGTIGGINDAASAGTVNYGTGSDMYNLVKAASIALKAIDSTIKILAPSATGVNSLPAILPLLQDLIAGGYIDVITYHFYSGTTNATSPTLANSMPEGQAGQLMAMQNFYSALKGSGISNTIPIWNTEFGFEYLTNNENGIVRPSGWYSVPEGDLQNAFIMRSFILAAAYGISRNFWYTYDNLQMGMLEPTTMGVGVTGNGVTHKSCVGAFLALQYWLTGRRVSDLKFDSGNNVYYVKVTDANGFNGMLIWNATAQPSYYKAASGYSQYQAYALPYTPAAGANLLGNGNTFAGTNQTPVASFMSFTGGTGGTSGTTMTVTAGSVLPGVLLSGSGVAAGAYILSFGASGTTGTGGVGTYVLSTASTIANGTTITALYQNSPTPIDPPVLQMLPNPMSLIEGNNTVPTYGISSSTYSPPNTFTVAQLPTATPGLGYVAGVKQYSGYGLVTKPVPLASSSTPYITLYYSPIMLLA